MTDILIEFDVPVPMSDGTVLRADVYRPGDSIGTGPWPVLLHRTPYGKRGPADVLFDSKVLVPHGYIVVHQDVRGRFASAGEWMPWEHERSDGRDSVAWAASLAGSSGVVGMIGHSYTGSTQWSAAIAGASQLRAIAPMQTWADPLDGLFGRGGALQLGLTAAWSLQTGAGHLAKMHTGPELMAAIGSLITDYDALATHGFWELPAGQLPAITRYGGPELGTQRYLREPESAEFNRVKGHHADLTVPSLNVAGWYDVFQQGSLDNYTAMAAHGAPAKLVIGPWSHLSITGLEGGQVGEVNFGLGSTPAITGGAGSLTEQHVRWFDHWLKDRDTGMLDEAPVKVFVMGTNVWRDEQEWPLARAVDTPWYLHADGRLGRSVPTDDDAFDSYVYDPADPVPTLGGQLVMTTEYPAGPFDQAPVEQRADVLVFTSEVLKEDVEVTGRVRMRLFASTDAPSTDWVARLCDVDESGTSRNLTDGIVRVTVEPGVVAEHEIDLWSTSNVFRAGHRIRVQVTSSSFPRWDRNTNTGAPVEEGMGMRPASQQVFRDAARTSHIILPVVPAES